MTSETKIIGFCLLAALSFFVAAGVQATIHEANTNTAYEDDNRD